MVGFLFLCLELHSTEAQVGINILQADSSAILHLESNDRGFLPPRLTTQQRDSINNPMYGLTIFNTEDSTLQYFTGRCWMPVWQKNCDECVLIYSLKTTAEPLTELYQTVIPLDYLSTNKTELPLLACMLLPIFRTELV